MQLVVALLPVAAFWALETWYGTRVATVAAIALALGTVAWTRWAQGRWAKLPLVTAALVVGLGGLSLLSDDPRFVRTTPIVGDVVLATLLAGAVWRGANPLVTALVEAEPDAPPSAEEQVWLGRVAYRLAGNLVLHGALCLALLGSDPSTWAFVSGPLQLVLLFGQIGVEALVARRPAA